MHNLWFALLNAEKTSTSQQKDAWEEIPENNYIKDLGHHLKTTYLQYVSNNLIKLEFVFLASKTTFQIKTFYIQSIRNVRKNAILKLHFTRQTNENYCFSIIFSLNVILLFLVLAVFFSLKLRFIENEWTKRYDLFKFQSIWKIVIILKHKIFSQFNFTQSIKIWMEIYPNL